MLCRDCPRKAALHHAIDGSAEVTRQAVTKHLGVPSNAGLVYDFRQGRERFWELNTQQLEQAGRVLDSISKGSEPAHD